MSALEKLAAALAARGDLRRGEPLSRHTTFGVGGPADLFFTARDADALAFATTAAHGCRRGDVRPRQREQHPRGGCGHRGHHLEPGTERSRGTTFRVESGASSRATPGGCAARGWRASPGRWASPALGGAVVYNAGAYGGCLADVLTRVRLQGPQGRPAWVDAQDLGLVYRGSVFTRGHFDGKAVLEAEVSLSPGDAKALLAEAASYDERRLTAQPRGRNAGSTFKNPPDHPAWKLIDGVGLRGERRGDAAISDKHCNFFVNYGNATAEEVAWLIREAERRVKEQFGVTLEREVAFVGAW
jgi:UDP-N-acetylmuramate dehydrogenase